MNPETEESLTTSSRLRKVRAVVAVLLVMATLFLADPTIEWLTGRSFRPFGMLIFFFLSGFFLLAWGRDIGIKKSAILYLFVPYLGFYFLAVAIYRVASLPDRYWGDTKLFQQWRGPGFWASTIIGLVFYGFVLYPMFADGIRSDLSRSFEESVERQERRHSSFGGSETVLSIRKGDRGFVVRKYRDQQSQSSVQWWKPVDRWYGQVWESVRVDYRAGHSFEGVHCQSAGRYSYCMADVPRDAAWFELTAGGRTYAGISSDGIGVAFVDPGGDILSWRAFDTRGVVIAGYSIDLTPRPVPPGGAGGRAAVGKKRVTPSPQASPAP